MPQVTITSVRHEEIRVRVVRRKLAYWWPYWKKHGGLPCQGTTSVKIVEYLQEYAGYWKTAGAAMPGVRYPRSIRVLTIKMSNGKTVRVGDHCLWVRDVELPCGHDDVTVFLHKLHHTPVRGERFRHRHYSNRFEVRVELPDGTVVNHQQASHLRVGQVVSDDPRLHFDMKERCVTDGYYSFPVKRPVRSEWTYNPIGFAVGVSARNWPLFLRVIIGMRVDGVVELRKTRRELKSALEGRQRERREQRLGQCFGGSAESIAIGSNLLFTVRRGEAVRYIVDSPNYGAALYVFRRYPDAMAWASRRITWREARERASEVHIHRGDWAGRLCLS